MSNSTRVWGFGLSRLVFQSPRAHESTTLPASGDWRRAWTQKGKKENSTSAEGCLISPLLLPGASVLAACSHETAVHSLSLRSGVSQQPVKDKRFLFICESVSSEVNQPLVTRMGLMTCLQNKTSGNLTGVCRCRSILDVKKEEEINL